MVMNILADSSSPLYKRMTEDGLINSSFSTEVFNGDGFFSMIFGGESQKPYDVMEEIIKEIESAKVNGLDKRHFEVLKKVNYGSAIRESNNVEAVANALINSQFEGVGMYDTMKIISEMTYEDVQKCLCERFDTSNVAISIVES
jgi:predicted Zn-dependent peptidase